MNNGPLRAFLLASIILLVSGCGGEGLERVRLSVDGERIAFSRVAGSISALESGGYIVTLAAPGDEFFLSWRAESPNPSAWIGERCRVERIHVDTESAEISGKLPGVGIIVEVTDATAKTVSGRFSGSVGVGAGSHDIDDGTFCVSLIYRKI